MSNEEKAVARLEPVLEHAESDFENAVSRYLDFLRIPSVSTDPSYKDDVRRAGAWLDGSGGEVKLSIGWAGGQVEGGRA